MFQKLLLSTQKDACFVQNLDSVTEDPFVLTFPVNRKVLF